MDLNLRGKRAAVAAATAGLGYAAAKALIAEGAQVVVCGRDEERLATAGKELGAMTVQVDVSTPDGATAFVDAAREQLGGIDILVTNAGGPPSGNFESTDLDAYAPALELNLLSTVAMCKAAVPAMQEQKWGRVVAITSMSVRQPIPNLILSNTARAGATGFLKTLSMEVVGDGVTVNSLQPGYHATDRFVSLYGDNGPTAPSGTVGEPDDFGAFVAFLCSDAAKFVTGTSIPVDGGSVQGLL